MWTVINAAPGPNDPYLDAGFALPKNLIPIGSETILSSAIRSYGSGENFDKTVIILSQEEAMRWNTDKHVKLNFPNIKVLMDSGKGKGALATSLFASDIFAGEERLIIASGDSFISGSLSQYIQHFIDNDASAGAITFSSSHPRWSHVRTDNENRVLEVSEKNPISSCATTGVFYFKTASSFLQSAGWVFKNNLHTNGRFYVSQVLNHFVLMGKTVISAPLHGNDAFSPMGLPSDYLHHHGAINEDF